MRRNNYNLTSSCTRFVALPLCFLLPSLARGEPNKKEQTKPKKKKIIMVITVVLPLVVFIFGLLNFYFRYLPSKKLHAWLQSFLINPPLPPPPPPNHLPSRQEKKTADSLSGVFATFDKNGDGFITKKELRDSFKNIRINLSERDVEDMVSKVDSNGDGLIDFEEFTHLCEAMESKQVVSTSSTTAATTTSSGDGDVEEGDLKEAFDVFDKDKDGLISVEELGSVLSSLGLQQGKKMEDCREIIRKVDMDGDGMVNFDEFKRMMKSSSGGKLLSVF